MDFPTPRRWSKTLNSAIFILQNTIVEHYDLLVAVAAILPDDDNKSSFQKYIYYFAAISVASLMSLILPLTHGALFPPNSLAFCLIQNDIRHKWLYKIPTVMIGIGVIISTLVLALKKASDVSTYLKIAVSLILCAFKFFSIATFTTPVVDDPDVKYLISSNLDVNLAPFGMIKKTSGIVNQISLITIIPGFNWDTVNDYVEVSLVEGWTPQDINHVKSLFFIAPDFPQPGVAYTSQWNEHVVS